MLYKQTNSRQCSFDEDQFKFIFSTAILLLLISHVPGLQDLLPRRGMEVLPGEESVGIGSQLPRRVPHRSAPQNGHLLGRVLRTLQDRGTQTEQGDRREQTQVPGNNHSSFKMKVFSPENGKAATVPK